jgi:hypothetical protein
MEKNIKGFTAVNFFPTFGHLFPGFGTGSGAGSGIAIRKNAGSGSALNQCGSTTLPYVYVDHMRIAWIKRLIYVVILCTVEDM